LFSLPAGMIGNPNAVPQCTSAQFTTVTPSGKNLCPPDTAVGVANTTVLSTLEPRPITVPDPLFNLAPNPGEPARFGFQVLDVPIILDTSVRTGGDYGVIVSVSNITEASDLMASQVTFWVPQAIRAITTRVAGTAWPPCSVGAVWEWPVRTPQRIELSAA